MINIADVIAQDGTAYRISLDDGIIVVTDLTTDTMVRPICSTEELAAALIESGK